MGLLISISKINWEYPGKCNPSSTRACYLDNKTKLLDTVIDSELVVRSAGRHNGHLRIWAICLSLGHSTPLPSMCSVWGRLWKDLRAFPCLWCVSISHFHQFMSQHYIIWQLCWSPDTRVDSYHLPGPAAPLLEETSVHCEHRNIVSLACVARLVGLSSHR